MASRLPDLDPTDETRTRSMLTLILGSALGGLLFLLVLLPFFATEPSRALLRYSVPILPLALLLVLTRYWSPTWTARLFVGLCWALLFATASTSGGLAAPGLPAIILLVFVTGVLLGEHASWVAGVVTVAAMAGMLWLQRLGRLEITDEPTLERHFVSNVVVISIGVLILTLGLRTQRRTREGERGAMEHALAEVERRNELEDQLRQVQKLEAIGELAGGVAHDFNNLLLVVLSNLDYLRSELEDPDSLEALDDAVAAATRGADLTAQLLAYSRRQTLKPRRVRPADILGASKRLLSRTLGASIRIHVEVDDDVDDCRVDASQLQNALLNLAVNARDAMPDGGDLWLGCTNLPAIVAPGELAPGDYVCFVVRDTGVGMPDDVIARAFEPFFTTKARGRGTGLGLAMVYGFVKQSEGHVSIQRHFEGGTEIRLVLPVVDDLTAEPTGEVPRPLPRGAGQFVLVVEDDPAVRKVSERTLRDGGYRTTSVSSAEEALEILEGARPDLLFTDVMLTAMDGAELVRRARVQWPGLPVLLTSGHAVDVLERRGVDPDVRLLRKPFASTELHDAVRKALLYCTPA